MPLPENVRSIFGMVYGIAAACTIFVNLLLLGIFCKENRYYKKFPFYTFARHLIYLDIMNCLIQLIITVPSTVYSYNVYIEYSWLLWTSWLITNAQELPHKGVTVFLMIAAVHRLFLFVYPQMESYCFREYASIIWRAVGWSYVVLNTVTGYLIGCTRVFSYEYYYFYWICEPTATAQVYPMIAQMESYMSLVIVFFTVLVIYFYAKVLRRSAQYNKKSPHEKDVLLQIFFICLIFIGYKIGTAIFEASLPANQSPTKAHIFVENLLKIGLCNVHPLSHLLINGKVRNHARRYFCAASRGGGKFQRSNFNSPVPPPAPLNYVSYEQLCQVPEPPAQPSLRGLRSRQQARLAGTMSV